MTLSDIIAEAEILRQSSEEDFNKKIYSAYNDYLEETNKIIETISSLGFSTEGLNKLEYVPIDNRAYRGVGTHSEIAKHREVINTLKKIIRRYKVQLIEPTDEANEADKILRLLFLKFHLVARQLRNRYSSRPTLDVEDEYDVQNLPHALLKINFDDIRPEENTPSYAGGSKRLDFLLKNEQIVIEVKKTRRDLTDKKIGDELINDISTYSSHQDCKKLYCFVYDPDGRISNPTGLEKDLEKLSKDSLKVQVLIHPK